MQEKGMTFHKVYCGLLIFSAAINLLSLLLSMGGEQSIGMASIGPIAINGITAAMLLMQKKAGYILQLISNIMGIVGGAIATILGFGFNAVVALLDNSLDLGLEAGGAILTVFGFIIAIFGIGSIVYHALVIKYYNNRKEMFTN